MGELETKLTRSGFEVSNINYPSRKHSIDVLAADAVGRGIEACRKKTTGAMHFVTHSLGGILVRYHFQADMPEELGRVVMLGPPNKGTGVVDGLAGVPGFSFLSGPTGMVLGKGEESILKEMPPANFDLGIIAGDTNINPLSWFYIDGPNDSLVSVESTKLEGMDDHIVLPVMHTLMMRNNEVVDNVIHFLKTGGFIALNTPIP